MSNNKSDCEDKIRACTRRAPEEFNKFSAFCQWVTCSLIYGTYYKIACGLKVCGRENVPKDKFFIVASNHMSAIDPFLVIDAVGRPIAYMAKKELFEKPISRFFLCLLGGFAVNREKLGVSTIKTAMGISKTNWVLGLFPQGTRETDGNMDNITRGFAVLAKTLKCDILPVAITGALKKDRKPFESKITIRIGKPIPFNNDTKEMVKVWSDTIIKLSQGEVNE